METHSAQQTDDSSSGSIVGVITDRETYLNLAYLFVRFPLGIAYFTVFVTGIAVGVSLLPLLVGVPILAGVLAAAGYVGVVEAALLRELLGRDVSWSTVDATETPAWPYLKRVATDPRNYLLLVLAFASFATGNALFVAIVIGFALAVSFAAAPLVYWIDGVRYGSGVGSVDVAGTTVAVERFTVDTMPEALAVSVVGIVVLFAGLHLTNITARVYADVTERLLSGRA